MALTDTFLAELEVEARTTTRVLERVPADKLEWTPHPKSMPLGKLAWHLAELPKKVEELLRAGSFDAMNARPSLSPSEVGEIVAAFHSNLASVRKYIAGLSDEALRETFTLTRGEQTLMSMPKSALIRTVLMNHSYHHRGQLAVYLRLLDVSVPSIYGPSADEAV